MYASTCCFIIQALLPLLGAALFGSELLHSVVEGDVVYRGPTRSLSFALNGLHRLAVVGFYSCLVAVIVADYLNKNPLSPDLQCNAILTIVYFTVHLVAWCASVTTDRFLGFAPAFAASKDVARVCPIICVMLVGMRVRIQSVAGPEAAPEMWCQVWMLLAACVVPAHVVFVFFLEAGGLSATLAGSTRLLTTVPSYVGTSPEAYTMSAHARAQARRKSQISSVCAWCSCILTTLTYSTALGIVASLVGLQPFAHTWMWLFQWQL